MQNVTMNDNPPGLTFNSEDVPFTDARVRYQYQMAILTALQSKHIYAGTVSDAEIARRRKANRVARSQNRLTINDRRK